MPESCYFYIDASLSPEKQAIKVICVECHDKSDSKVGSYWDGSLGYGPFNFICFKCGKIIHDGTKNCLDQ